MKYVIVGGSIAAATAYSEIKKYENYADIKVISKEKFQPYGKMLLPYLISTDEVKKNMFFEVNSDDIVLNDTAASVDIDNKVVKTKKSMEFQYDKLLIAAGADAYIPEYKGSYSDDSVIGVRYLKDIEKIENRIASCENRHVILVGAGLVTLEMGWALVKRGFSVTYIVRSDRILSQILDKESADLTENYIEKNYPVNFIKGNDIEFIEESNGSVYVKLISNDSVEGCAVVVGKGVRPNVEFLQDTGIEVEKQGVIVNGYMRTNMDDIYAAGDIAAFDDVIDGQKKIHAIWPVAVEQAKTAARNMMGVKTMQLPEFTRNVLPVFDLNIFTGGASKKDDYDVIKRKSDGEYRKIILKNGKLKGFILIGDIGNFGAYTHLAKSNKDVSGIVDKLLYGTIDINRL